METETVISIISAIISVTALICTIILTVKSRYKNRAIYDVEQTLFFKEKELKRKGSEQNKKQNEKTLKKLNSGKYTILSTGEYGGYIQFILGKIKK